VAEGSDRSSMAALRMQVRALEGDHREDEEHVHHVGQMGACYSRSSCAEPSRTRRTEHEA
jgi:hypothetical protein